MGLAVQRVSCDYIGKVTTSDFDNSRVTLMVTR